MHRFKLLTTVGIMVGMLTGYSFEEKTIRITGFVGTVGSNLGTTIDGSSPDFAERDPFEIRLRFDADQVPYVVAAGTGQTASYRLLETSIRIFGDEETYTWGFSTPLMDNPSHDFGIHNDYYLGWGQPQDKFTTGSFLAYTGPTLGPGEKAFSHWGLTFYNNGGTTFSDTSIPSSLDLGSYVRLVDLTFVGYMAADQITLSVTNFEVLSAVPEPSTWASIAGAMALGVVVWGRRATRR